MNWLPGGERGLGFQLSPANARFAQGCVGKALKGGGHCWRKRGEPGAHVGSAQMGQRESRAGYMGGGLGV